jgi:hypothetical protein
VSAKTALEQVDEQLVAWDERLRRMDENLVALESEAIYQFLAGKAGKRPTLEGVSKKRVGPALDAVTELFENRERLSAVLDRARAVRASISALTFWDHEDKLGEIRRLLWGPSIELGQKVVALSERSLLDVGAHDVTVEPELLLAEMVQSFERAREVLLAVSRAWESVEAELGAIEAEAAALRKAVAEIHPPAARPSVGERPPELDELVEVDAAVTALRARVARDPLGAEGGLREGIGPRLAALSARVEAATGTRRRALAALDAARAGKVQLDEDHTRAITAHARARHELEGDAVRRLPAPLAEGQVVGLDEWLHKLARTVEAARWQSAEIGLARFSEALTREHDVDRLAARAAEALLARPTELRGRLSARRAQAAALTARGQPLDPGAAAAAREAEELLSRKPLPIDAATRAVELFESSVVAAAKRT